MAIYHLQQNYILQMSFALYKWKGVRNIAKGNGCIYDPHLALTTRKKCKCKKYMNIKPHFLGELLFCKDACWNFVPLQFFIICIVLEIRWCSIFYRMSYFHFVYNTKRKCLYPFIFFIQIFKNEEFLLLLLKTPSSNTKIQLLVLFIITRAGKVLSINVYVVVNWRPKLNKFVYESSNFANWYEFVNENLFIFCIKMHVLF